MRLASRLVASRAIAADIRNLAFRPPHHAGILRLDHSCTATSQMPQAAVTHFSGRRQCTARPAQAGGRPPPIADGSTMPGAIAPWSIAYSTSPLVGLPSVQRVARRRIRRSAIADVRAERVLQQRAIEWASEILPPRQVLVLQLYCEGLSHCRHRNSSRPTEPPASLGRLPPPRGGGCDARVPGAGAGGISLEFPVN